MHLTKIEAVDFRCFTDLNLELPIEGFTLLTGKNLELPELGANGVGKSSLFDAICWCLYKKTAKGQDAGELQNYNNPLASGYAVTLTFNNGETVIYRAWKPNKLQINGRDVEQHEIDAFIRLNYEQFLLSCYAHQGATHFIDLTPGAKLAFLNDVFELDRWQKHADTCKDRFKDCQADVTSKTQVMEVLARQITETEERIKSLAMDQIAWQQKIHQEKVGLETQITETKNKCQEWAIQDELSRAELKREAEGLEKLLIGDLDPEGLVGKLAAVETDIKALNLEVKRAHCYNMQNAAKDLQRQLSEKSAVLTALSEKDSSECPTCKQSLPEDLHTTMCAAKFDEMERLEGEVAKAKEQCVLAETDFTTTQVSEQTLRDLRDSLASKAAGVKDQFLLQTQQKARLSTVNNILAKSADNPHIATITMLEQRVKELSDNPQDPYEKQILQAAQDIETHKATLETKATEKRDSETKASEFEFWQKTFPEVSLDILNELVDELAVYFNQAMSNLGLFGWDLQVQTERGLKDGKRTRKEINLTLTHKGKALSLDGLSGGEKQRLRIASAVGLSDLIKAKLESPVNFLLLDEPSLGLSAQGIDNLISYLSQLSKHSHIMMAEHRVVENANFDKIIEVVKNPSGVSDIKVLNLRSTNEAGQHLIPGNAVSAAV